MTYHYCKLSKSLHIADWLVVALPSGSDRAIPWKKLVPRIRDCVEEEHLPSHLLSVLGEPLTLKEDQCHSLLTFWYTCQTNGMTPTFRFKRYLVKDNLVDALGLEKVDTAGGLTPPLPSNSNPDAKPRGNRRQARRKQKSKSPPMDNIFEDNSDRNACKDPKSGKESKGKDKGRDSTSQTSSCADSTSSSDCESTKTTSTSDCDDSLSHRGSEQSRRSINNISPALNPHKQFLSPPLHDISAQSTTLPKKCGPGFTARGGFRG